MISKKKYDLPLWKRLLKVIHDVVVPFLWMSGVICGLLSCFQSAEGSNSRLICICIAVFSFAVIFTVKFFHNRFRDKDTAYRCFQYALVEKLDLANLLPLLILTLLIAIPFYMVFVSSLKNPIEANAFEFTWWPKEGIDLNSYKEIFQYGDAIGVTIGRAIINSFIYAIIPTTVGLLSSAIAAYAFSKLRFRGRNTLYNLLIMTMMMPGCVTMATGYLMYDWYGWTNSPLPLIVPGLFGGAACVMFLREFFMGIPDGLLEAAEIDGAGTWRRFIYIMLPLAKPALTAQFILGFISSFNDYMGPLIYLNDPSGYTIQVALSFFSEAVFDNAMVASACVCAIIPMLLLYILFQKTILSGISISSGIKG